MRLVEELLAKTSIPWIRFLYAYPTTLDEDLLRLMGSEKRFCSYMDIPLQHSHGDILSAMRRGGDAKRYLRLLDRARELAPDIFLRSTFLRTTSPSVSSSTTSRSWLARAETPSSGQPFRRA